MKISFDGVVPVSTIDWRGKAAMPFMQLRAVARIEKYAKIGEEVNGKLFS
jgi:hypothetical protein